MGNPIEQRLQLFDPAQEYAVLQRRLPHWSQAGTVCFLTWRTWDSIPDSVLRIWLSERDAWLRRHAIDPLAVDWRTKVRRLGSSLAREFQLLLSDRWNEQLDACHGECVLHRPDLANIVAKSLRHFDGDRYELTDFVVMPNHVHVLVAFPDEHSMLKQCESWKHFTAARINRALGRRGRFWQQDGFDHLVRSEEQLRYLRRYIVENPARARLQPGEYLHESKVEPSTHR
jgi:putative transposase